MEIMSLNKVLELPPNERVTFAELILASIEHEEEDIRKSWISEVYDRIKAVKEGKSRLLDFEELYYKR
ncbi:MAG: addiction module protein [Bacteroidetes bacterium]|nr:addiction module protein [Bacteroidota bacterium]MBU1117259.1 addiction module protein [Bacteroidota bacterium]MBU1797408.1 addiction module protein [Bacteroidota bacterium]